MLEKLIHENQKGFLSGRYIGENIKLVYDILSNTEQHNKPGIILLIDFEKAFDSLSWRFLFNVINFFNFGPDFTKWIKIILMIQNYALYKMVFFHHVLILVEVVDREILSHLISFCYVSK